MEAVDSPFKGHLTNAFQQAKTAQRAARITEERTAHNLASSDFASWRTDMKANRENAVANHHITYEAFSRHLPSTVRYDNGSLYAKATRIAKLYCGNERCEQVSPPLAQQWTNQVYRKRGTGKEYVKDVAGSFVKRLVARADDGAPRLSPSITDPNPTT